MAVCQVAGVDCVIMQMSCNVINCTAQHCVTRSILSHHCHMLHVNICHLWFSWLVWVKGYVGICCEVDDMTWSMWHAACESCWCDCWTWLTFVFTASQDCWMLSLLSICEVNTKHLRQSLCAFMLWVESQLSLSLSSWCIVNTSANSVQKLVRHNFNNSKK